MCVALPTRRLDGLGMLTSVITVPFSAEAEIGPYEGAVVAGASTAPSRDARHHQHPRCAFVSISHLNLRSRRLER